MKNNRHRLTPIVYGTLALSGAGIISRCIGFVFRIMLSNAIGAEGMGIFQLSMPVMGICVSVCGLGLQTALSKLTAEYSQTYPGHGPYLLKTAALTCLVLCIMTGSIVYLISDFIAFDILKDYRCSSLIRLLIFSLPFGCLHCCFCGSFYGNSISKHPALSQLIEQLVRISSLVILWSVRCVNSECLTLFDAAFCTILSEAAALLYCFLAYLPYRKIRLKRTVSYFKMFSNLFSAALPLSASRLASSFLTAAESMLLPVYLKIYGLSHSEALSMFGIFSGMAMPFILFALTFTNSLSVLLLPQIASDLSVRNKPRIIKYSCFSCSFSLVLGCACTALFYLCGDFLGGLFFKNTLAGEYLKLISWICPFMYLGSTCSSILNGLGRIKTVLLCTCLCFVIRIGAVVFLVPVCGFNGYMSGLLTACIFHCAFSIFFIGKKLASI